VVGIFVASNAREDYSIALPIATGLGPCRSIVQEGAAPVVPASSFLLLPSDVRVAPS